MQNELLDGESGDDDEDMPIRELQRPQGRKHADRHVPLKVQDKLCATLEPQCVFAGIAVCNGGHGTLFLHPGRATWLAWSGDTLPRKRDREFNVVQMDFARICRASSLGRIEGRVDVVLDANARNGVQVPSRSQTLSEDACRIGDYNNGTHVNLYHAANVKLGTHTFHALCEDRSRCDDLTKIWSASLKESLNVDGHSPPTGVHVGAMPGQLFEPTFLLPVPATASLGTSIEARARLCVSDAGRLQLYEPENTAAPWLVVGDTGKLLGQDKVGLALKGQFDRYRGLACDAAGAYMYVAESGGQPQLLKISMASGVVVANSLHADAVLINPAGVAISGSRVFVADYGNGNIVTYDSETLGSSDGHALGVSAKPWALAATGDELFVSDEAEARKTIHVLRITPDSLEPARTINVSYLQGNLNGLALWNAASEREKPVWTLFVAEGQHKKRSGVVHRLSIDDGANLSTYALDDAGRTKDAWGLAVMDSVLFISDMDGFVYRKHIDDVTFVDDEMEEEVKVDVEDDTKRVSPSTALTGKQNSALAAMAGAEAEDTRKRASDVAVKTEAEATNKKPRDDVPALGAGEIVVYETAAVLPLPNDNEAHGDEMPLAIPPQLAPRAVPHWVERAAEMLKKDKIPTATVAKQVARTAEKEGREINLHDFDVLFERDDLLDLYDRVEALQDKLGL